MRPIHLLFGAIGVAVVGFAVSRKSAAATPAPMPAAPPWWPSPRAIRASYEMMENADDAFVYKDGAGVRWWSTPGGQTLASDTARTKTWHTTSQGSNPANPSSFYEEGYLDTSEPDASPGNMFRDHIGALADKQGSGYLFTFRPRLPGGTQASRVRYFYTNDPTVAQFYKIAGAPWVFGGSVG
ncbi:MAG: hypothetical protein ACHREM_02235 [Polyangiales bacterium]